MKKVVHNLQTGETTTVDHTDGGITLTAEEKAARKREDRDLLLSKTDWRAASDLTLSTEWAAYRQALRDVPQQTGFPDSIAWPEKPE